MSDRGRICEDTSSGSAHGFAVSPRFRPNHHAEADWVERACRNLAAFLHGLRTTAEQLTPTQRWHRILSGAMVKYLHGCRLQPPDPRPAPT